jgi:hypothetical protein
MDPGAGLANLSSVDCSCSAALLGNQDAITGFGTRHHANEAGFPLNEWCFADSRLHTPLLPATRLQTPHGTVSTSAA